MAEQKADITADRGVPDRKAGCAILVTVEPIPTITVHVIFDSLSKGHA
jgi:hypothetical protein